jgi:uncharacterized membrane protein
MRHICQLVAVLVTIGIVAEASPVFAQDDDSASRLMLAVATQGSTRARLGVLAEAFTCPEARFVSYRRSDAEPELSDQWYVASQLWADAYLLNAVTTASVEDWDAPTSRCYLDKGFVFLDRL